MKNKYLNKFFCITMLSAMVLACPTGVRAADATETVAADGDFSDGGEEVTEPEVPSEPEPTEAPEATATPTPGAEPAPTATPVPTETPQPTATPAAVDEAKVQAVINRINALADKTVTADSQTEIAAARAAYDALSDAEKAKVTNYATLTDAEQKLADIQKKANNNNNSGNGNSDITDGNNATATQIGNPVYVTNMVSNLHAGKDFYLDSLKNNYHLTFSDDFASVMDAIEKEYKEKNKLTDSTLVVRNWQDILAIYI